MDQVMLDEKLYFVKHGAYYLDDNKFYQKINFKNYEKVDEYARYSKGSRQTDV